MQRLKAEPGHPHEHHDDHRGWVRPGGQRGRWLEPFALLFVAHGEPYGAALLAELNELCLAPNGVDVGMLYRTLREFEAEGLVVSHWEADTGAPRRAYRLTEAGRRELDDWIGVMRERRRLTEAFLERAELLPATK
jgi:PadR family transcriptional regulator, regulatory protein PadR